jgi:hypothetical protein
MKTLILILTLLGAHVAYSYEYKLQFTPQAGAYGLAVAGYQFYHDPVLNRDTVLGNCSYYTVSVCSGRGCPVTTTYYYNACTWDTFGNLISLTPVSTAPVAPQPISETGTEIVYAINGASSTGQDTGGFGFVSTPSSHYSWQTVNGGYAVIPYAVYPITATLISDGDFPLNFAGATVASSVSGTITPFPGTATVSANTCGSSVPVGSTCSVTVSYNPTTISYTSSPYGYAYTTIDLSLITDAGANTDFTQGFTITGIPMCGDGCVNGDGASPLPQPDAGPQVND